jgi:arginase family enzyme
MHLQLLDLDGSLAAQHGLSDALPWESISTLALRDLGPRLRLWSRQATIDSLRARLESAGAKALGAITLIGSGDFHHVAVTIIERAAREAGTPFTIVHIDNHPDWVRLAPRWHCGSWVNRVLRIAQVARVVTLGVCSDDLVRPDWKGGNLRALDTGRLVLLPWRHAPSRVGKRIADGIGHRYADGHLVWENLSDGDFAAHLSTIVDAIPTEAVWITIDKDVLPEHEVTSNWDQGEMPLARVLETIRALRGRKRILGADICGEYAPAQHANWFKRIEARMDQPRRAVTGADLAQNERVNIALLRAIAGAEGGAA